MTIFSPYFEINDTFYRRNTLCQKFYIGYFKLFGSPDWIPAAGLITTGLMMSDFKIINSLEIVIEEKRKFIIQKDAAFYIDCCILNSGHKICNTDKEYSKYKILV